MNNFQGACEPGRGQMTAASASIEASHKALGEEEKKKKLASCHHHVVCFPTTTVSFVFKCQVLCCEEAGFQL